MASSNQTKLMLTKNFPRLKSEVERHIAADKVAQGSYKTCFIGCLANQRDNPEYIEDTYGIPAMVTRIAESIFEGLPPDEAPAFFSLLPAAVGCDGKDLSRVPWQFLSSELRSLPKMMDSIQAVISPVIAGMDLLIQGLEWSEAQEAARAADAAYAAYATSAADSRRRQRDLLLKLIKEAPVVGAEGN